MTRVYRVDIVLANGERRRGKVELERPNVVVSANYDFTASDNVLEGAVIVSGNEAVRNALKEHGFTVAAVNAGSNVYSVRLKGDLVEAVSNTAHEHGLSDAATIAKAVEYWYGQGCPIDDEKRR